MEEGWEKFLISNVNNCIEVVDKHRHKNVLVAKSRSIECGNCGTYSVVDEVKNLKQESEVDSFSIEVKYKFNCLKEAELKDRVECCLAAQVVKKCTSSKKGVSVHAVGGADNIILVKESQKPVILVKSNEKFMTALLDTGSEKCLINYKNLNCLTKDSIKESNVVKGVNSSNSVIGEVTLELQLNEQNVVSTNALILKNSNFSYDLILGRDLLKSSQIDLENRTITLNGERICFLEQKRDKKPAKRIIKENKDTSCLLNEVVSMRRRKRKKIKVEALCAEKVTVRDLNVHCHTMTILANSINIINCFCRDVAAGEYIMPKHSLRNGLLIAESLVKIEEKPQGLVQSCAVLSVNMYDKDITVSDNGIVGSLTKCNSENVISESFLYNFDDSIWSKQNLTTNDGGGRKPSSMNCSSEFCEDSTIPFSDLFCNYENRFCSYENQFCTYENQFCTYENQFCTYENQFCTYENQFCTYENRFCTYENQFCTYENQFCNY